MIDFCSSSYRCSIHLRIHPSPHYIYMRKCLLFIICQFLFFSCILNMLLFIGDLNLVVGKFVVSVLIIIKSNIWFTIWYLVGSVLKPLSERSSLFSWCTHSVLCKYYIWNSEEYFDRDYSYEPPPFAFLTLWCELWSLMIITSKNWNHN